MCIAAGSFSIWGALFAAGYFLYADYTKAIVLTVLTVITSYFLLKTWMRISAD
jgi:hypothetical protein